VLSTLQPLRPTPPRSTLGSRWDWTLVTGYTDLYYVHILTFSSLFLEGIPRDRPTLRPPPPLMCVCVCVCVCVCERERERERESIWCVCLCVCVCMCRTLGLETVSSTLILKLVLPRCHTAGSTHSHKSCGIKLFSPMHWALMLREVSRSSSLWPVTLDNRYKGGFWKHNLKS
jgi:hypothetical protein